MWLSLLYIPTVHGHNNMAAAVWVGASAGGGGNGGGMWARVVGLKSKFTG